MPPPQCPECGRFLSKAFMVGLADGAADCPRCEAELTPDRFDPADLPASVSATEVEPPSEAAAEAPVSDTSVRPPDLPPSDVEHDRDVLEGWDHQEAEVIELLERRASVGGAGPSTVIGTVLGAGVAGGLLGAVVARNHRPFGAIIGTLAGACGAVLGMRLFEDV